MFLPQKREEHCNIEKKDNYNIRNQFPFIDGLQDSGHVPIFHDIEKNGTTNFLWFQWP